MPGLARCSCWPTAEVVTVIVLGVLAVAFSMFAFVAMTLLIAAYFLLDGVARIGLGLDERRRGSLSRRCRSAPRRSMSSSPLTFALGAKRLGGLIGPIVGINLLVAGASTPAAFRIERSIRAYPPPQPDQLRR